MLRIELAGAPVVLHPSGAAFLPADETLLIADAHFGKAVSFRQLGVPVPRGT
ncbi:MAG: DEAD/DEAH box helicase, partial [Haliea sp.]